jgi:hypothetical protein
MAWAMTKEMAHKLGAVTVYCGKRFYMSFAKHTRCLTLDAGRVNLGRERAHASQIGIFVKHISDLDSRQCTMTTQLGLSKQK